MFLVHLWVATAAGHLGRASEAIPALAALRGMNSDLLDPDVRRRFWSTWLWREEVVNRHEEGFEKALKLVEG